jgi:hypothetical protein
VFHVGPFEVVWTLAAVYAAALLTATVTVLVLIWRRGGDRAARRN